ISAVHGTGSVFNRAWAGYSMDFPCHVFPLLRCRGEVDLDNRGVASSLLLLMLKHSKFWLLSWRHVIACSHWADRGQDRLLRAGAGYRRDHHDGWRGHLLLHGRRANHGSRFGEELQRGGNAEHQAGFAIGQKRSEVQG